MNPRENLLAVEFFASTRYDDITDLLPEAKTFYLSEAFLRKNFDESPTTDELRRKESNKLLSLPFQTVIFDCAKYLHDSEDSYVNSSEAFKRLLKSGGVSGRNDHIKTVAILAHELEPGQYTFFIWIWDSKKEEFGILHCNEQEDTNKGLYEHTFHFVDSICEMLRGKTIVTASEQVNRKLRTGNKKNKSFFKLSKITHILVGKKYQPLRPVAGGKIDWSISWEVRGHWRHVVGIGKDRNGVYAVKGATWVVPHVKGDKTKPLLHQARIVKPSPLGLVRRPVFTVGTSGESTVYGPN